MTAVGVCQMCAHLGDTSQKTLCKSHVVPRSVFMGVIAGNSIAPKNTFISLTDNPETDIHASQDQGAAPMLCAVCELRLSTEIEKPVAEWVKRQTEDRFCELDSVLHCRFVASVWWRAMISKHNNFRHVKFDYHAIHDIMVASLDPAKTLKTFSFRLRCLTDSTGNITKTAWKNSIFTIAGDNSLSKYSGCRPSFVLMAGGFRWEVFYPRRSRSDIKKCRCMTGNRRHQIHDWDFASDRQLIAFAAQQLAKATDGKSSPAFKKHMAKKSS